METKEGNNSSGETAPAMSVQDTGLTMTASIATKANPLDALKELTAADILGTPDVMHEWVPVPEWGGKVRVKSLSGAERDRFEASLVMKRNGQRELSTLNIRAKLCQLTIVDPKSPGEMTPVFSEEQIDALGRKSAAALSRVYDVASRLSGLSAADVEELRGNSGAAGSAAS